MNHEHHGHHGNENIFMGGEALPPEFADYEHLFRPQQVHRPSITSSSGRRGFSSKKLIIVLAIIFGCGILSFLAIFAPAILKAILIIAFGG